MTRHRNSNARTACRTLTLSIVLLPLAAGLLLGEQEPGEKTFLAQECNKCHSVESYEIERTATSEKLQGPDLTDVGNRHDTDWMRAWILREVESAEGKKHTSRWKGTDKELKQIIDWLATLKQ